MIVAGLVAPPIAPDLGEQEAIVASPGCHSDYPPQ